MPGTSLDQKKSGVAEKGTGGLPMSVARALGGSIDGLDQLTKKSAVARDLTRTRAHIQ
jgi:hypothetical protein